ncbi:MAG: hypothetical protein ACPG47_04315 [Leucothrix sp.]
MSELFLKASEIRERFKLTISDFSSETDLSESTIKRILKDPCYKGSITASRLINDLYNTHVQSPFPERIEAIDTTLKIMIKEFSKSQYKEYGDPLLQRCLELDHEYRADNLTDARIHWLLGHLCFERANLLKNRIRDNYLKAINCYQTAYKILQAEDNPNLNKYLCQIKMTSIAATFNPLTHEERHSAQTKETLEELGFVSDAESLLIQQPWQYAVARNALVVCSLLRDLNRANIFADHLVKLSPQFFEPGFQWSPDFTPATQDPDLKWFMDKRRHSLRNHPSQR